MGCTSFNLGFQSKCILSPWCMLFHLVKVLLKVSAILFRVLSAHCDALFLFIPCITVKISSWSLFLWVISSIAHWNPRELTSIELSYLSRNKKKMKPVKIQKNRFQKRNKSHWLRTLVRTEAEWKRIFEFLKAILKTNFSAMFIRNTFPTSWKKC